SALNGYVRAIRSLQPITQAQQIIGHRRESAHLFLAVSQQQTRHQHLGVHVNPTTNFMHYFHGSSFRLARESLQKKILLCKFTRLRDVIRWYLGKALRSNFVTGSASSHRRHSQPISTPRSRILSVLFQRSNFSCRGGAPPAHASLRVFVVQASAISN